MLKTHKNLNFFKKTKIFICFPKLVRADLVAAARGGRATAAASLA
jgi:hypothetical protein